MSGRDKDAIVVGVMLLMVALLVGAVSEFIHRNDHRTAYARGYAAAVDSVRAHTASLCDTTGTFPLVARDTLIVRRVR